MSDPVGNSPRNQVPGNSHKSREVPVAPEPREKVEKIIVGKVVTRKASTWKRVARSMVADDVQDVGDFVLVDVLVPAVKNLIFDIISQGSSRVLFGTSRARRPGMRSAEGPVSSLRTAYHRASDDDRRPAGGVSREAQARHNFDELILENRAEAVDVIESLIARVNKFGSASVSDLYDYLGVTGSFTDLKWGWHNLTSADVRQTRGGFLLDLPAPVQLR